MKAIILVAGYATRLYPLTKDKPKALLPLCGKPILDYILEQVYPITDVNEVIVVSNAKFYPHFQTWAAQVQSPIPITVLDDGTTTEEDRRGAIGDLAFAIESCHINEDIMVIAGDNYFTYPLIRYYNYFKEKNADCICVKRIPDPEDIKRYAVVVMDEQQKVLDLEEKPSAPKSDIAAFATYIYKQATLPMIETYLKEGNSQDAPGSLVQWLHKRKAVYAYEMEGDCYDIGTPQSYEEVQEMIAKGTI